MISTRPLPGLALLLAGVACAAPAIPASAQRMPSSGRIPSRIRVIPGQPVRSTDLPRRDLPGVIGRHRPGKDLSGKNLAGAKLAFADLRYANLARANLTAANLSGAQLTGANLSGANLKNANLRAATLFGAILTGANLGGAQLRGALYNASTRWPGGVNPQALGARLARGTRRR
jgi:hypothetical protein